MGILEESEKGRRFALGSRCLLGRHPACDIRVDEAHVSGEHASLHWKGDGWELRDLGSRNGTFLEGRRLASGERVAISRGQSFRLGQSAASFRLADVEAPAARARNLASQEVRESSGFLLVLPDDETPEASVFLDEHGRWVLETGDSHRAVEDHEQLTLGGEVWLLELPTVTADTLERDAPSLEEVHMKIGVSRDEEHVAVTLEHRGRSHSLPPRSYHYLLALLARIWLSEQELPVAERGWVERETLCQMLKTDSNKLNVDIHRARKQFSTLGIENAAGVVERRQGSGQLRLGIHSVEVSSL